MKIFAKESAAFIVLAFIIWTILEIIYDLITVVTLADIYSCGFHNSAVLGVLSLMTCD